MLRDLLGILRIAKLDNIFKIATVKATTFCRYWIGTDGYEL